MKEHRLIVFYGASPGVGKSTFSSYLFEQLSWHKMPVLWVYEDDVLTMSHFAEFIVAIQSGDPQMIDLLQLATRSFVQECLDRAVVAITDSIYPCINWLIAMDLYTRDQLAAFSSELERLLAPLNPLVIFLEADPKAALQHAMEQRGEPWGEDILGTLNSYPVNHQRPLQGLDDMVAYFRIQAYLSLELIKRWSCDLLVIDTMLTSPDQVKKIILSHLGIEEIAGQPDNGPDNLERYTGVYHGGESGPVTNPLLISSEDGKLWVNTYWPNGCPLLAEGAGRFRLESTSHCISFELEPDGAVVALTYEGLGFQYRFEKVVPSNR